jgi:CRISPR system Cascade subunit CasC
MKLIELHILQSFPVSCLNRDDVGSPKTAVFGGVNRARISSQCLKRPLRLDLHERAPSLFAGERSKLIIVPLADRIEKLGLPRETALNAARTAGRHMAGALDEGAAKKGVEKVKTLMFLSPGELDKIAAGLAEVAKSTPDVFTPNDEAEGRKKKKEKGAPDLGKIISKACAEVGLKDAADVALFGRMVASDHSLTVEGAAMFSHALSTHKADNDIDFYTAVDDRQKDDPTIADEDRTGSGMMGTLEFSSAVYYRYAAVNLGMLADKNHLSGLSVDQLRAVVDAFLRATLFSMPSARRNSMNGNTLPSYVVGVSKNIGQPVQLVNAFERPTSMKGGDISRTSSREMLLHRADMNRIFGLAEADVVGTGFIEPKPDDEPDREGRKLVKEMIPDHLSLDEFCKRLTSHVH